MKKRMISFVLALCFVCMCGLLVSCETESTFSVINTALKNTQNLDSIDAEMKMEMNMAMEGMTMAIPVTADIRANGLKSENMKMSTDMSMTMLGQTVEMSMYQEGDWAYMVFEDMKYKTNIAETENEYDYSDDVEAIVQDIPEELLENVELVKNDGGSQTVTVSIPDDQFAEIYNDYIDSVNSSNGYEGVEVSISDAEVSITVADGYISVYDLKFTMTMEVEGISSVTEVTSSVTYKNPGEEVTVTPPEGYKDFEELDLTADLTV